VETTSFNPPFLLRNPHVQTLANRGYNVLRFHFQDYGPSHNLSPELFNSTRLQEVVDAVREIEQLYPNDLSFLTGHSLGGNFSLGVAAIAPEEGIKLRQVVAVCPVLSPTRTMSVLEMGQSFYGKFLLRQWKRVDSEDTVVF